MSVAASGVTRKVSPISCNICDSDVLSQGGYRDIPDCPTCNSTPRTRAVIHVLSIALFGHPIPISQFPERRDLIGIGLSDWGYDKPLAAKLGYRNTFLNRQPRLDITDPPGDLDGTLDFLISSDVLEHVPPPVQKAFDASYRLLKPGGVLVLTVPYVATGKSREHFPDLGQWKILDFFDTPILVNHTDRGWEVFDNLSFHRDLDGSGSLEMRILSHAAILEHLRAAGFRDVTNYTDFQWNQQDSFPFLARKTG